MLLARRPIRFLSAPNLPMGKRKELMDYSRLRLLFFSFILIICSAYTATQAATLSFKPLSFQPLANELHGQVKDSGGQTIKGAAIVLTTRDGRQITASTNAQGEYQFKSLRNEIYLVKIEAPGFRTQVEELDLTKDATEAHDITLTVDGIAEEVIITANNSAQSVAEISKSLSVVSRKEIDAQQEHTIAEALHAEPGLRVRVFGGPGNLTSLRFRGLGNENTSVLIDGLRVRDAGETRGSSLAINDSLFVDNVEKIELLRGSGSSLYGTNAVGGVINIVPYTGVGAPSGELSFEGGSLGQFREAGRIGGSFKDQFSYSLAASRIDVNDGIDGMDIYRTTNFGTSLRYIPSSNFSLSGIINYSRSFLQGNDSPFPIGPKGNEFGYASFNGPIVGFVDDLNDPDAFRTVKFLQTGFSVRHRVSNLVSYYGTFNFVRANRRFFDGPDASQQLKDLIIQAQGFFPQINSDATFKGLTYTFTGGVNLRLDAHHLVSLGFEAEKERLRQRTDFFGKESFAQKTFGFNFQDQVNYFANRLQLSVGGRIQAFKLDDPEQVTAIPADDLAKLKAFDIPRAYTGDASIAYSFFNTGTKLRAHVGNSFRAPALSERFSAFDGSFFPVRIGNPFLRPERAVSVDGGIDQSAFNNRLRMSLSYFYTRRQEIITSGFVPFSNSTGSAFFQSNGKGGLARGLEASVTANPLRGLDLNFSYLYVNSEQVFSGVFSTGEVVNGSTPAFGIPRNTFSMQVNHRYRNFNINFDLVAASEYDGLVFTPPELFTGFASPIFRFDGYVKADITASYTFPLGEKTRLEIFGKGSNIGGDRYFEDGFKTPGATGSGGVRIRF